MLESLISIFAPHECLGCGVQGTLLCASCRRDAPLLPERCYRCRSIMPDARTCVSCRASSPLHTVQVATEYAGLAKDLVWQLKFSHAKAAVRPMAALVVDRLVFEDDVILVHVPTASSRVRQRGYDQAELLSRQLSRLTSLPIRTVLSRHGQARQVGAGRSARAKHLTDAFRVRKAVRGQHIVLIDDVLTTGATLESAARQLRRADARRVDAIVFAQA